MRTITTLLLVGALAAGCKNKAEDAAEARETANEKQVEAANAQREAEEKAAEARRELEAAAAQAHTSARAEFQKAIDASDRKLTYLRGKLGEAKGNARKNADAASQEIEVRKAKVEAEMQNLQNATGDAFEAAKLRTQAAIAELDKGIENLEDTLD